MQYLGKTKIGKLSAKGFIYPQLRLPQQYAEVIGNIGEFLKLNAKENVLF
jgi:hypothetical protein